MQRASGRCGCAMQLLLRGATTFDGNHNQHDGTQVNLTPGCGTCRVQPILLNNCIIKLLCQPCQVANHSATCCAASPFQQLHLLTSSWQTLLLRERMQAIALKLLVAAWWPWLAIAIFMVSRCCRFAMQLFVRGATTFHRGYGQVGREKNERTYTPQYSTT